MTNLSKEKFGSYWISNGIISSHNGSSRGRKSKIEIGCEVVIEGVCYELIVLALSEGAGVTVRDLTYNN